MPESSLSGNIADKFERWSARKFGEWLELGFLIYGSRQSKTPFPGAEAYFDSHRDIVDDIATMYFGLSAKPQDAFRRGLQMALARIDLNSERGQIATIRLLALARHVSAIGILPEIKRIRNESHLRRSEIGQRLLFDAAETAIELASRTDESYKALVDIAVSRDLEPAISRNLLVALCKAAPDKLLRHLRLLRTPLTKFFLNREVSASQSLGDQRCSLLLTVARWVVPSELKKSIDALNAHVHLRFPDNELSWWGQILEEKNLSLHNSQKLQELIYSLRSLDEDLVEPQPNAESAFRTWMKCKEPFFSDKVDTEISPEDALDEAREGDEFSSGQLATANS